jgi:hypothetical protein
MAGGKFSSYNDDKYDILAREIIQENTGEKDPELSLVEDFFNEIDMRLEQVKIYFPIMEILRKRKVDDSFIKAIPELCFLVFVYLIYEGKLKHKGVTFENMENFICKAMMRIQGESFEKDKAKILTEELLDTIQNGGRNFVFNTYNYKIGSMKEKYIKFIEIKQSEEGVLQYYITEQGVDFFLKTKEFPDETKITINLLLFQKQMEKGAFGFAYETVRRLNMEVQKKKDKKYSLLESLMYGKMDSGEEYSSYHKSIVLQFEEESELFSLATENVKSAFDEFIERINNGDASEKEIRTFTLIKIIEKEIGKAQTLHTELLKEAASFTREYDKVLGVRRKAIFTERFSFQGEFERITQNERPEVLKYIFEPLLNPRLKKAFNPLRVLEQQSIVKSKQQEKDAQTDEKDSERMTEDDLTRMRVKNNFVFYASKLIEILNMSEKPVSLKDFCNNLIKKYNEEVIYNGDFISFIIEMNREKNIGEHFRVINFFDEKGHMDKDLKSIEEVFVKAVQKNKSGLKINQIIVKSISEEEIEVLPGLKVTNIVFAGERKGL